MIKVSSYKNLSIVVLIIAAALAIQFLPLLTRAQVITPPKPARPAVPSAPASEVTRPATPAQPTPESPLAAPAPTTERLRKIEEIARSSLLARLKIPAEVLKKILLLKPGETLQSNIQELTTQSSIPALFEKFLDPKKTNEACLYLPGGIRFDFKKPIKVATAKGAQGTFAQLLNFLRRGVGVSFDEEAFPWSICFNGLVANKDLFISAYLLFGDETIRQVLAQGASALLPPAPAVPGRPAAIAPAPASGRPRPAVPPVPAIAPRLPKPVAPPGRPAVAPGRPKPTVSQQFSVIAPGRPQGTPGAGTAVLPTPPPSTPGGAPSQALDFGDARVGFPTLLSENGPRHRLSNRVWLGDLIDGEADGLRTNRDDETGVDDDEDGMLNSNPFVLLVRTGPQVNPVVYINAWEDRNANNRWDINANRAPGDEWIVRNQRVSVRPNSVQSVSLLQPRNGPDGRPLPAAWSDPAFWVRFTVTEASISNGNPALGQLPSGETEDYIGVPPPAPYAPGGGAAAPGGGPAAGSDGGGSSADFVSHTCPNGQRAGCTPDRLDITCDGQPVTGCESSTRCSVNPTNPSQASCH